MEMIERQKRQGGYQQGRGGAAQSIGKTTRAKILQLEVSSIE